MTLRMMCSVTLATVMAGTLALAQPQATLPEIDQLRADNLKLRAHVAALEQQAATCRGQLSNILIEQDRVVLEQRFRDLLKPPAGATFNWQTMQFDPPPGR